MNAMVIGYRKDGDKRWLTVRLVEENAAKTSPQADRELDVSGRTIGEVANMIHRMLLPLDPHTDTVLATWAEDNEEIPVAPANSRVDTELTEGAAA